MPSARASSRATAALRRAFNRLARVAALVVVAGFGLFALALLAMRFVVFPRVDAYRDTVTEALSRQLGQPVEIAALSTGWDGWNPKIIVEGFRVRDGGGDVSLLELPEVDLIVAWTSLPLLELRLKQLVIDRPRLSVRRDRAGMLHIAGIEIDPERDDARVTDWILRQRQIVIRDALVTWNDDLRNAPQLVLDRVQFRLESRFGYHRFGLRGTPPPELAAPLDVRGEVRGAKPKEWQSTQGRLYVRLDYADVAAWREWLPLPPMITSGKGALRLWFQFANGEAREIVADLELADVRARLDPKLPELAIAHLSGRAGWRGTTSQHEFFTNELAFVTPTGQRLDPTTLTATLRDATRDIPASGRVEFDRLQIEPLRDLAAHLPLPEKLRVDLARFAPRGTLAQGRVRWEGPLDAPTALTASSAFDKFGVVARDTLPGASGLTGSFEATLAGGELKLATRAATLEFPRVLSDPIALDSLQGVVSWERKNGRTRVDARALDFANGQGAGSLNGTYRTDSQGPGEIDLVAQLNRADPEQIHRYLPVAASPALRDWLRGSLVKGTIIDVRVKLAGNLAKFPFTDPKSGQFVVTAKGRNVTIAYARGWPALEDVDADVRYDAAGMTIEALRGRTFGLELGRTRAVIADLRAGNPLLSIDGSASGPIPDFLRFVEESPVAAMIGHFTDGAAGAGTGRLALKLSLPLKKPDAKVSGELLLANGELRLPDAPAVTRINGALAFTEDSLHSRNLAIDVMGGPAKLAIAGAERRVRVTGSGTANLGLLRRQYTSAYLDRISGTVDWTIAANVRPGFLAWVLESPMKGAVVELPAPLGKAAGDAVPLRIERQGESAQEGEDRLDVTYGRIAQVAVHRKLAKAGATADRVLLSLGRAAGRPDAARAERSGVWVRGELPQLNVDDWLALRELEKAADNAAADTMPPVAGVDLDVGDLDVFGRQFNELKVVARQSEHDWKLDLHGREIEGMATWSVPDAGMPNGRVVGRLVRFAMPGPSEASAAGSADKGAGAKAGVSGGASPWPEIDIAAESFSSQGRDLGRLEVLAKPQGSEWRIEKLVLSNDDGRIDASGAWRTQGRQQQTKLDVALDAQDAGVFLTRFGYPDALQGAPTRIDGQLAWAGAPNEFDYPTLTGTLRVAVGPGRFVKIEPGFGKLLGVLSLQSLPRRISLDFRDVFSDGFAFDDITGNVRVVNGVMSTDNLALVGPAAKVNIAGDADLARETQRLTVRVQPSLSGGVSAGAALLFLANPIVGAAVGAGSLLAQKVLKDPIEQIFSYQYMVTGGWSDPVVTRSGTAVVSVAPGTPGSPVESTVR